MKLFSFIARCFYTLTGGRPMIYMGYTLTTDPPAIWKDRFGRTWAADHAWSWRRTPFQLPWTQV